MFALTRPLPRIALQALTAVTLVSTSSLAWSQTRDEMVQRILAAQKEGIEAIGSAVAADTSQQILSTAGQALQAVPQAKREATGKAVQDDIKKFYEELQPQLRTAAVTAAPGTVGGMLKEKMSDDELRQAMTWFESSASKKYDQLAGDMQTKLAQQIVGDTRESVQGKLKTLEGVIRKRLEDAGAKAEAPPAKAPATKGPAPKAPATKP
jgi:uncharacterized protein